MKHEKFLWCSVCRRTASKGNMLRHFKTHHLLCKLHFKLHPRVKSKCFGLKLIKKSQMYKLDDESETLIHNAKADLSVLFVPVEIRADCWRIFSSILSARDILDSNIYAPFFFCLSMIRSNCPACCTDAEEQSSRISEPLQPFIHLCRSVIEDYITKQAPRVFNLFGLELEERNKEALVEFLTRQTYA